MLYYMNKDLVVAPSRPNTDRILPKDRHPYKTAFVPSSVTLEPVFPTHVLSQSLLRYTLNQPEFNAEGSLHKNLLYNSTQ